MLIDIILVDGEPILDIKFADIHHDAVSLSAFDGLCGIRRHALQIAWVVVASISDAIRQPLKQCFSITHCENKAKNNEHH